MATKITDVRGKSYNTYRDIEVGDCFLYGKQLYMKVNTRDNINHYISLKSGQFFTMSDIDTEVTAVDVEFVIHNEGSL